MASLARRIVVATDFSRTSELALDTAALLARQNDAKLTLVHVVVPDGTLPMIEDPRSGLIMADDETRERLHLELHVLCDRWFADLPRRANVALVVSTSPSEGICQYAEDVDADLIVIATHGRTGLARMLNGSVAEHVVRHAPCPVLSLRNHANHG